MIGDAVFSSLPKAELHVHLEGSLRPERILQWVQTTSSHPWKNLTQVELISRFKMASFPEFIESFMTGYRLLDSAIRYQQATEDLCLEFQRQGVTYAEVLYSPGVQIQHYGRSLQEIHRGIAAGLNQFPNLKVRFVLDTVLNLGPDFMMRTLDQVLHHRPDFLCGFSIGGGVPEINLEPFLPLFEKAQNADLVCMAHVGEVDPASNVSFLVAHTDIQRIAHGCSAAADLNAIQLIKNRNITIDICPTSNKRTGASAGMNPPPAVVFHQHGIPITLNTDDPLYFQCDLEGEYRVASEEFGFDSDELKAIMVHGLGFEAKNAR